MNGRNKAARILVTLGVIVLVAGALLHCVGAYPRVAPTLRASNLNADLQGALRTVFLLVGWDWIVIAVIVLIAAFTATKIRKAIVIVCGLALLVTMAVMLTLIGWFVGTDLMLFAAVTILGGGLLFEGSAA